MTKPKTNIANGTTKIRFGDWILERKAYLFAGAYWYGKKIKAFVTKEIGK